MSKPELTKEQTIELNKLALEMEADAIQMRIDYEKNPSEESGSVIVIHENSEWLDDTESELTDEEE